MASSDPEDRVAQLLFLRRINYKVIEFGMDSNDLPL